MSEETTKIFTAPELYLLAAAFGGKALFGLPEKEIYQLKGDGVFQEAYQRLIDKEILTTEGKITRGGAFIIQAVEMYHQSKKYVRINNLMFAFQEKNQDESFQGHGPVHPFSPPCFLIHFSVYFPIPSVCQNILI